MGRVEGELSVMPLADLVIWLANRRLSGQLIVDRSTNRTTFSIDNGMVVRAASNNPRHHFGQFLLHYNLASEEQLQQAFETQKQTGVLLGRILVMIGIAPEEQIIQTLRVKFVENMLYEFRWRSGSFEFIHGPLEEHRSAVEVAVPLLDIYQEGAARSSVWQQYHQLVAHQNVQLTLDERRIPTDLEPQSLEARIIAGARAGLSIEAIVLDTHATDYQVASRLVSMIHSGIIHTREPSMQVDALDLSGEFALDHLQKAKEALATQNFLGALRHVQAGSKQDPTNPEFPKLRRLLETRSRESSPQIRDAIPVLKNKLTPEIARNMSAKQRYLLGRIDGRRSIFAIIQVSPMHDFEAIELLKKMEADGMIELRTTKPR